MPNTRSPRVKARTVPLADLVPRKGHANKLPARLAKALACHIGKTGLYQPLTIRLLPGRAGKFELIDGHQRAAALARLGHRAARCEVWPADEQQAEILSATLNHIRGRCDAKLRASQVARLIGRLGQPRVAELLALTPAAIRQHRTVLRQPPTQPAGGELDLRAVTFHLPAADAAALEDALHGFGEAGQSRGQRLLAAVRQARRGRSRRRGGG